MQITVSLEVVYVSTLESFIFCADGMLTGMLTYYILDYISHNHAYIYRAWQKKLHASVHDDGHKAKIYKYLWMLMTEGDPTVFQKKPGGISNILGKEGARIHFLLQRLLCQQSW